jgi:hypothetical protein
VQVEIYDEREIDSETLTKEPDAEALALIDELGLTAQKSEDGARICYPTPTADQAFVMAMLFPKATRLEGYDAGGIPLRVLKEIRSYRMENPSHILVVRHAPPSEIKDPVLLAYTGTENHDYYVTLRDPVWAKFRMVARWGDALDSWESLVAKASKAAGASAIEGLRKIVRQAQGLITDIEQGATWRQITAPVISGIPNNLDS